MTDEPDDPDDEEPAMRAPFRTAILRANRSASPACRRWWRGAPGDEPRGHPPEVPGGRHRAEAGGPDKPPEAAVDVTVAERPPWTTRARARVAGRRPDDQPVRFLGPDEVARELDRRDQQ